ncbi:MAG: nitroreductase family protein [Ruminococcaceae bacterium]|nr:nitroreductase family protein [Oscillospiraceae bacterium]
MNEVIQAMVDRRSIKKYESRQVPAELLEQILQAGIHAATGMGKQSPVIVVLQDEKTIAELEKMNAAIMGAEGSHPFYGAPTVLVVLANADIPTAVYDGSLVMGNLLLAASALGLGGCWIHRAKEEFESEAGKVLLREWGLEGNYIGIGHCIVGYGAAEPAPAKPRKENYIIRP